MRFRLRNATWIACTGLLAGACDGSNPFDTPAAGSLTITVQTTGNLPDPNGYQVTRTGGTPIDIPVNGSVTVNSLAPGSYTLTLGKASLYCAVENGATRTATVAEGGTAQAAFTVRCERNGLAYGTFSSGIASLHIAFPGRDPVTLATGVNASRFRFSPDGRRIAYAATPTGGTASGIQVMDLDSLAVTQVTPAGSPNRFHPYWSPDGTRITYATSATIRVIRLGETTETTVWTAPSGSYALMPTWSPDGQHIAFIKGSLTGGAAKILYIRADGTGEQELFTLRSQPYLQLDWSPDGRMITVSDELPGFPSVISTVDFPSGTASTWASAANRAYRNPTFLRDGRIGFYAEEHPGGAPAGNWIVSGPGSSLAPVTIPGRPGGASITAWQ